MPSVCWLRTTSHTDADHILVTSGSQEGLDFSARVFLNPGDVVLLESPSYLGAVNAFKASRAQVCGSAHR
ncbi:MAG: aminotransferase class I/II-fold pyridoxal phosphate-dependent enzyme [Oscillospiraceae bacterium]